MWLTHGKPVGEDSNVLPWRVSGRCGREVWDLPSTAGLTSGAVWGVSTTGVGGSWNFVLSAWMERSGLLFRVTQQENSWRVLPGPAGEAVGAQRRHGPDGLARRETAPFRGPQATPTREPFLAGSPPGPAAVPVVLPPRCLSPPAAPVPGRPRAAGAAPATRKRLISAGLLF